MKIELLSFTPDMAEKYENFIKKCFEVLGWEYGKYDKGDDARIIDGVSLGYAALWCLMREGEIIGSVAVRALDKEKSVAELKRLYVSPNEQGKGYGETLFKTAYLYAAQNGYKILRADTTKDRAASRHLLQKYGFVPTSDYNGNPYAELFYECVL
ncbi:MAG: GNAT family N-acetyltransferase [Clostridiales bacterium]|nr:GNAT family N-acetyltransferase [Clostridiales bacterium]